MQVKAVKRSVIFAFTLGLAACASKGGGGAGKNPFDAAEGVTVATSASASHAPQLRLLFVGNVNGETEPCGCAVNPKGGLDRRYNYVKTEKKNATSERPLILVDAGNALFPTLRLDPSKITFLKDRARTVLRGSALMGLEAQNVGALDLSAGLAFLKDEAAKAHVSLVSASWTDSTGRAVFPETRALKLANGLEVTITGLSAGRESPIEGLTVTSPSLALSRVLAKVPPSHLVIVLSDLGVAQDKTLAATLDRPMLFVGGRDLSNLDTPVVAGRSLLVQSLLQGQQWGTLDLGWKPTAEGWFGLSTAARYSEQWKRVDAALVSETDSVEKAKLLDAHRELLGYAPVNLDRKIVYDHHLVDMTEGYGGKNELTAEMQKVKTPR